MRLGAAVSLAWIFMEFVLLPLATAMAGSLLG
jgi:hypothetical protein